MRMDGNPFTRFSKFSENVNLKSNPKMEWIKMDVSVKKYQMDQTK